MPKASEVAAELRKMADAMDRHPDLEIVRPWSSFFCSTKQQFLAVAKIFPRPISKSVNNPESAYPELVILYETPAMKLDARMAQSYICRMVEPAKVAVYECEPILSDEEEASIEMEAN